MKFLFLIYPTNVHTEVFAIVADVLMVIGSMRYGRESGQK